MLRGLYDPVLNVQPLLLLALASQDLSSLPRTSEIIASSGDYGAFDETHRIPNSLDCRKARQATNGN